MAALSAINSETLEAAAIDCRSALKRFRYIVFPEIKAMIVVLLVYNALTAFTSYDLVYAMTGGGPGTATTLLSFQIWRESFSMYDFGAGSAVAFIVVAISAVLIVAITRALPSDLFEERVTCRVALNPLPDLPLRRADPALHRRPVLLSLVGSVVPDRILLDRDKSLFAKGRASRPTATSSPASCPPPICRRAPTAR